MRLHSLRIRNLKFIRDMELSGIENALILVGKNSTGKSSILKVIRALAGTYAFSGADFNEKGQNIEVDARLLIEEEDLHLLHDKGVVSGYRGFEAWKRDFCAKLPSFADGILTFHYVANQNGSIRFEDDRKRHNKYIPEIFPKVYFMDTQQDFLHLQEEILMFQEDDMLSQLRQGSCMFNQARKCTRCFRCIGLIRRKTAEQLNILELSKLLEYRLYQRNLDDFSGRVNAYFRKNSGSAEEIHYSIEYEAEQMFQVQAKVYDPKRKRTGDISTLGKGMHRIYMLSLLEAYVEEKNRVPSLILMEDPETFLHPGLQKAASEILYRLSKKNQVVFTTHSPNLL